MAQDSRIEFIKGRILEVLTRYRVIIGEEQFADYWSRVTRCEDYAQVKGYANIHDDVELLEYIKIHIIEPLSELGINIEDLREFNRDDEKAYTYNQQINTVHEENNNDAVSIEFDYSDDEELEILEISDEECEISDEEVEFDEEDDDTSNEPPEWAYYDEDLTDKENIELMLEYINEYTDGIWEILEDDDVPKELKYMLTKEMAGLGMAVPVIEDNKQYSKIGEDDFEDDDDCYYDYDLSDEENLNKMFRCIKNDINMLSMILDDEDIDDELKDRLIDMLAEAGIIDKQIESQITESEEDDIIKSFDDIEEDVEELEVDDEDDGPIGKDGRIRVEYDDEEEWDDEEEQSTGEDELDENGDIKLQFDHSDDEEYFDDLDEIDGDEEVDNENKREINGYTIEFDHREDDEDDEGTFEYDNVIDVGTRVKSNDSYTTTGAVLLPSKKSDGAVFENEKTQKMFDSVLGVVVGAKKKTSELVSRASEAVKDIVELEEDRNGKR